MDDVYDEFVEKYRAGVAELVAGDPMDPKTTLAPLSSQRAAEDLAAQVEEAIAGGATAERVGPAVPERGFFFQPTILTDVAEENPVYHQELFGPVTTILRAKDEADAIRIANDSRTAWEVPCSRRMRSEAAASRESSTPEWSTSTTRRV